MSSVPLFGSLDMTISPMLVVGEPAVLSSSCPLVRACCCPLPIYLSAVSCNFSLSFHPTQSVSLSQALHRNIIPCPLIIPHNHHHHTTTTTYPSRILQSCLTCRTRVDLGGPGPTRGAVIGVDLPALLEATVPDMVRRDVKSAPLSLPATKGRCHHLLPPHLVAPETLRAAETLILIFSRPIRVCRHHRSSLARLCRARLWTSRHASRLGLIQGPISSVTSHGLTAMLPVTLSWSGTPIAGMARTTLAVSR
jgi:hypothetical protein